MRARLAAIACGLLAACTTKQVGRGMDLATGIMAIVVLGMVAAVVVGGIYTESRKRRR